MVFLSFLACETMVDDYILYGSAVGLGESREVQPLWLIREFSALLAMRLGKFPNKLWYFPLANIRAATSVHIPYIFSPRFFGGCIIRLADWTCLSRFIGSTDWDKGLPHR